MKFNVQSKALYSQAAAVSKVISSKNPMPILNNFLLDLKGNVLTITASDIENTLTAKVPVLEAEGEGRVCVDAPRLTNLLKSMPDIGISFESDDNTLAIQVSYNGCKGQFDFVGVSGDEYPSPQVETSPEAVSFVAPSNQILSGIENTIFAVGADTLRPMMMGIYWDIKPEEFTFVATDTRKLVRYRSAVAAPGVTASCIVPTKPSQVIRNILPRDVEVSISIDDKRALLKTEDLTFSCQLLKGNYPPYERVIAQPNPYLVTIDRVQFLSALRRVSMFGDQGKNIVKLRFTPSEVVIKAVDNNYCTSAVESVACDFNHDEMIIGFSSSFIIEVLSTISTEEVNIALNDSSRPGVFSPGEQGEGTDVVMILMPVHTTEF